MHTIWLIKQKLCQIKSEHVNCGVILLVNQSKNGTFVYIQIVPPFVWGTKIKSTWNLGGEIFMDVLSVMLWYFIHEH